MAPRSVYIVCAHFNVVDQVIGEVNRGGKIIGCSHLTIYDEFQMMGSRTEIQVCRQDPGRIVAVQEVLFSNGI